MKVCTRREIVPPPYDMERGKVEKGVDVTEVDTHIHTGKKMKTFKDIMKKREELMNECRLEGVATIQHMINGGVYGMLWAVGREDAPGLPQPHESRELLKRADIIHNQWPSVSRLYDYRAHKELYKKCYNWVRNLSRVAQGKLSLDDLTW